VGRIGGGRSSDRGAVMVTSLTKWVVAIAVLCIVAFDGFSIVTASVRINDDAATAARIGNETYQNSSSQTAAIRAVESFVHTTSDRLISVRVLDGSHHSIEVTLGRTAPTILASVIPQFRLSTHPQATVIGTDPIS